MSGGFEGQTAVKPLFRQFDNMLFSASTDCDEIEKSFEMRNCFKISRDLVAIRGFERLGPVVAKLLGF